MSLNSNIESILFAAGKPVSVRKISKELNDTEEAVRKALDFLFEKYNTQESGIHLVSTEDEVQMVTNAENKPVVDKFVRNELAGELTKAQLEALTVIAYQGPITRPELEEIRGVNCALIVRNLLMRGLIEEQEDVTAMVPLYKVSCDALSYLGIHAVAELPEYETLHNHEYVKKIHDQSIQKNPGE